MIGKWEKVHYGDYPFLAKCSRCGHEIDTHYEGKHPNFCSNCGLPMNEEAARRLKTDLSDWIPTSEMLPDEYDSYLVMWRCLKEDYPDRLFYEICEYYPEEDEWERIEQAGEAGAEIVAWMPLPEKYEPKEKENG